LQAVAWCRDPPLVGRAPAAVRRSSRARAAGALGGEGKARARAMSRPGRSLTERVAPAGSGGRAVSGGVVQLARPRYLPIGEHGLIGALPPVALVGTGGTIDWYCCPRFDS